MTFADVYNNEKSGKYGNPDDYTAYNKRLQQLTIHQPEYLTEIQKYQETKYNFDKLFEADLILSIQNATRTTHEKASIIFRVARELGQDEGYHNTIIYADELTFMVKEFNACA